MKLHVLDTATGTCTVYHIEGKKFTKQELPLINKNIAKLMTLADCFDEHEAEIEYQKYLDSIRKK